MSATAAAIPMFDYVQQYARIKEEILAAIEEVLSSGSLILGPRVRAFEGHFADWLGVPGFAVGVGNGTDALAIALRALDVGPGDEVITVANTAVPTGSAICMVGARPVFSEIDPRTLLMDLADAESRITPRTKAIVAVHLFGNALNMPRLAEMAARHHLALVEDCAQASGTTWQGRHVGTFGDAGCFSFYPTKNLGAYGDGGLCFTRSAELAAAMRQIRAYGLATSYDCQRTGVNSRLDELQAAILDVKLRHLPAWLARRRQVAACYDRYLDPNIVRPGVAEGTGHSYHLYVIESGRRASIIERLKAEEIGFGIHYPKPLHGMPGFQSAAVAQPSLPITEHMASRILSLPCYPELSLEAVQKTCSVVNDAHHQKCRD